MLRTVARRDDLLMLADQQAGLGAVLHREGADPRVVHIGTAFGAGYWEAASDPLPDLPAATIAELAAFNQRFPGGEGEPKVGPTRPKGDSGPSAIRSSAQDWEPDVNEPDAEGPMEDDDEAKARRSRQLALLDTRAAGHDVTPGHDELHHYWTVGAGRRKWVDSPKPWTTLVALLTRHVGPEKAKIYASRWFIEVKGYAAGSDLNRVAHGHPPRGNKVGPG